MKKFRCILGLVSLVIGLVAYFYLIAMTPKDQVFPESKFLFWTVTVWLLLSCTSKFGMIWNWKTKFSLIATFAWILLASQSLNFSTQTVWDLRLYLTLIFTPGWVVVDLLDATLLIKAARTK